MFGEELTATLVSTVSDQSVARLGLSACSTLAVVRTKYETCPAARRGDVVAPPTLPVALMVPEPTGVIRRTMPPPLATEYRRSSPAMTGMLGVVSIREKVLPVDLGNAKTDPALAPAMMDSDRARPVGASLVARIAPDTSDQDPPPLLNEYSRTLPVSSPAKARSSVPTILPGKDTAPASPSAPVPGVTLPNR